ncbi:HemK2/MTQ2 family protein methyltransferase [Amycolatopsis endophytica]|uniref:HemK2/MTQ2 family protein methyltransferase n=1 Tax=Amycolatopsis endophytica TaxID=860233 RepID=UPI001C53B712|nr:HemK2/MTQ2 family protein methyltransferase [Amycolatopsis endophytica]
MRLLRLPGVYRPQADTWLMTRAMREARLPDGARVLEVCTGTGALAIAAVRGGAGSVTAVDRYLPAVLSARFNTRRYPVEVRHGDLSQAIDGAPFDVVLANPPYVPCESSHDAGGAAMAWDAGADGRRHLDCLCDRAFELLSPGGTMLVVHSSLCGIRRTVASLRDNGLKTSVVARAIEPFGPVLRGRVDFLERAGLIAPGQRHEELVVIRADRTER